MNHKNMTELINEAIAVETQEAREAGTIGFMARALVQASLPHKKPSTNEFTRTNGSFTMFIMAPSAVGLPYGSIPRLILSFLSTEAVKTKQREIILGDSLSSFMRSLDLDPTGGRHGSITRLKNQIDRLFKSSIMCSYTGDHDGREDRLNIFDSRHLWWDPKKPEQIDIFTSSMTLTQKFFDEITQNPVPVDLRIIKALKQSPLGLDIYCWLTYRMSYLRRPTVIPWAVLEIQFGSDYKLTRQFKAAFNEQMKKVLLFYPEANISEAKNGLLLKPSSPSVRKLSLSPVDKKIIHA